jgi:iron complex transport system substrate-binding protein
MRRSRTLILAPLLVGLLLAAACGDDDEGGSIPMTGNRPTTTAADAEAASTAADGTFPVTVDAANGSVEIAEQPHSIVSLSPTATEMIYGIDAGEQLIAVDNQSDYPTNAPIKDDLSGYQPNVEAITKYDPDLVLVERDTVIDELKALNIPVIELPTAGTLDDSYKQIQQLGQATGRVTAASDLVSKMQTDVQDLVATVPQTFAPVPVYHEIDDTGYTITGGTFLGQIYQMAGLANIAASIGGGQGYQQISPEQVIADNPQWIFLAYGGDPEVAAVKARPGWNQIAAVQQNHVVALDPAIASRWGPRTVDLLEKIIQTTAPGH